MGSRLYSWEQEMRELEARFFDLCEQRRKTAKLGRLHVVACACGVLCSGFAASLNFLRNREILGLCLCFLAGYEMSCIVRTIRQMREDTRIFREAERSYEACKAALELAKKKENEYDNGSNERT